MKEYVIKVVVFIKDEVCIDWYDELFWFVCFKWDKVAYGILEWE